MSMSVHRARRLEEHRRSVKASSATRPSIYLLGVAHDGQNKYQQGTHKSTSHFFDCKFARSKGLFEQKESRVEEEQISFRLRLSSVSGFPRSCRNIRLPYDPYCLPPLQTGRAEFPHPAYPK